MVCGSCIVAAAGAAAGTMGFFRLVDMVRSGGLRKTLAFLRGDRRHPGNPGRTGREQPEGEECETLSGGRSTRP